MGNKLGGKRVDEKYTRPQGLYQHKDIDHNKLRKLILDSKLAPCYPGQDDCTCDLEECPICFLSYPSLNRSRCCMKGICTECFLQMKMSNSMLPSQCPFCKTFNYAVEYRGVKTKEEKGLEQIEEQRVIDAKIRMRLQEIQEEEERMQRRQDTSSSSRIIEPNEVEYISGTSSAITNPSGSWQNRDGAFDQENIMLMEAFWLSFQEGRKHLQDYGDVDVDQLARYAAELHASAAVASQTESTSSSSPSGGPACTVASAAKHQAGVESSTNSTIMLMFNGRYDDLMTVDDHSGKTTGSYVIQDDIDLVAGSMIPESFEEQMMVAMAVSLSEAWR
ncbi:hypothetical protein L1987_14784 [Smallanthus sonchifolius]|uniref:Uncharacterized protein n=1 Tax=Smallanthus sonchifolius TaxID=185202 RepID=A0ACB9J5B5_9ASTR|nr:hypothetical protein L1987_14784 [Smallanthus sonchifolius]